MPEQTNASIVRVKKLFPGQPAAESGKIDVGDVILKVNGASLKGLSQQVSEDLKVGQWVSCPYFLLPHLHLSPLASRKSYLLSGEQLLKCPCSSADPHQECYQKLILHSR